MTTSNGDSLSSPFTTVAVEHNAPPAAPSPALAEQQRILATME